MAASLTAPRRSTHSVHVYYVRAGDASRPVDLDVDVARDGGALSTRKVTACQEGQILLEALASFNEPFDSLDYQQPMPDVTDPDSLPPVQEQLVAYADELDGFWVGPGPSTCASRPPAAGCARSAPSRRRGCECGGGPTDRCHQTRCCTVARRPTCPGPRWSNPVLVMRRATPVSTFNALIDHALWFHRPIDLTDWVLSDQVSSSGVAG